MRPFGELPKKRARQLGDNYPRGPTTNFEAAYHNDAGLESSSMSADTPVPGLVRHQQCYLRPAAFEPDTSTTSKGSNTKQLYYFTAIFPIPVHIHFFTCNSTAYTKRLPSPSSLPWSPGSDLPSPQNLLVIFSCPLMHYDTIHFHR